MYCQRSEAENRVKETQPDLSGTRASRHRFLANWLRALLAGLAYTLMQWLKDMVLAGTELYRAPAATIRVRLLKIGAAVIRNTRYVSTLFASHHPARPFGQRHPGAGAVARRKVRPVYDDNPGGGAKPVRNHGNRLVFRQVSSLPTSKRGCVLRFGLKRGG